MMKCRRIGNRVFTITDSNENTKNDPKEVAHDFIEFNMKLQGTKKE